DDNAGSHGTRMECEAMARKSEAVRSLPAEVGRRSLRREGCTEHGGVLQNIFSRAQPLRVADLPSDFERTDAAARRERLPYPGSPDPRQSDQGSSTGERCQCLRYGAHSAV